MTTAQHLRRQHGYDCIPRGTDVERVHAMDHRALRRRDAEDHQHAAAPVDRQTSWYRRVGR